ncbi:MAG: amidase family protein, partial [Chloroflexota bacterium]
LGLVRQHFFERAEEEMCRHTEEVVERLRRAGAEVPEITLPNSFEAINETHDAIVGAEAAAYHKDMFAQHKDGYRPAIRQLVERGMTIPATQYALALEARLQQRADMEPLLQTVDALITPGTPGAAPRSLDTTGSAVMQRPWSVIGLPAISLPTGLNKEGLPLAIQLVGPPRQEDRLMSVALWCERTLGVRLRPPLA